MDDGLKITRRMDRGLFLSIAVTVIFSAAVAAFLVFYFSAYQSPYLRQEIFDLSEGWRYESPEGGEMKLDDLTVGLFIPAGEPLTLHNTLCADLPEAAVLIRTNHQSLRVSLGGVSLYADSVSASENPGIAQRLIALPDGYLGKTLSVELVSPYADYSGRVSPVLMGTEPSLRAYVHSESLRPLIMAVLCFVVWLPIVVIGFLRGKGEAFHRERLAVGVFAVLWGLFFVSSEYDVFPFFTPAERSVFCLAMYFLLSVPLSLYYYFSFERYKKWMLPAVVFYCVFAATALSLQFLGIVELPRMITLNNLALACGVYTNTLAVLEAKNHNRDMKLAVPFLLVTYVAFLFFYFYIFYTRRDAASYYFRDFYFLLVLAVLVYSIWHFFRDIYRQAKENEMLSQSERQMRDSYENFRAHLRETARLKHDMQNHFLAMQTYLEHGHTKEARDYLARYAGQSAAVTEAAYSEHFLMNAVVGNLYRRAGEQSVRVTAALSAVPRQITDPDLYSLLSNLTDNALEACSAVPEGEKRFIDLSVTRQEPYLCIRCQNSKAGDVASGEDGRIETTKSGDGHGYGLWIIGRIVDAYDGMMNVGYDQETFTVTLALKDKSSA